MTPRGDRRPADARLASQPAHAPGGAPGRERTGGQAGVTAWISQAQRDLPTFVWLVALAIAAAYVAVFLIRLPHNITALSWDSDYASEFTVPETLVHTGTSGNLVIASSGQWVGLWFGLLTAGLPLHRELWGAGPTILFAFTALTVGWSVSQLAGRRAGALAVLIGFVTSPLAMAFFIAPAHLTVYLCTALAGAYLIWLTRGQGRRRLVAFAVPPVAGVAAGTCLSSDLLIATTVLIPLSLTAILAGLRRDRSSRLVALSALTTVAVAIPVAKLTTSIMTSLGFQTLETPDHVAPLSELAQRAKLLFKGLKALFNGYLGPESPGTFHTELGFASTIVMSLALLTLVVLGVLTAARFAWSGLRKRSRQSPAQLARSLHIIYWVSSAAVACGAFWLAGDTGGGTDLHESYYGTVIFSVAAVIPLLLSTGSLARCLIPAGASVLFIASLVGLASANLNTHEWVTSSEAAVLRIAKADHVTSGYGGYLQASSLTWNTDSRVTVRPLMECPNPAGASICPFYMASVPSWYVPHRRKTFLLTSSEEVWLRNLPSGLGKPLAAYTFGPVRMYIYPYDIASRLGPQPD
ncbi:MAG TPA: hypothetical protein VIH71_09545 [Solirubrobacteraceae bacterium]